MKEKIYWTRDILQFFGVDSDDMKTFLNFHQIYKFALSSKLRSEDNRNSGLYEEVTDRTGSYWNKDKESFGNIEMDS